MIKNVQTAFQENLNNVDWMDDKSRDAALAKVKNILVLLGYPDFAENKTSLDKFYKNFRVCEFDNYGNARTIRAFKQAYQFTQLGKPDRTLYSSFLFLNNLVTIFFSVGVNQHLIQMLITIVQITKLVTFFISFVSVCNNNTCSCTNGNVKSPIF